MNKQANKQSVCWICDGWIEQNFSIKYNSNCIYIHFDFEDFEPRLMNKNKNNNEHKLIRMVP